MAKQYKNIPVPPDIYERVKLISQENGRTMGGQVMVWARECPHPADARQRMGEATVMYPGSGITVRVQILHCRDCNRLMVLPSDPFDADQRAIAESAYSEPERLVAEA
jgi:hypothetical protein